VLPNYVNQVGVALASPVTVRAVPAVGPVLVFLLQTLEGRLSPSWWTLAVSVLYALVGWRRPPRAAGRSRRGLP
jgi:hypothetical protein